MGLFVHLHGTMTYSYGLFSMLVNSYYGWLIHDDHTVLIDTGSGGGEVVVAVQAVIVEGVVTAPLNATAVRIDAEDTAMPLFSIVTRKEEPLAPQHRRAAALHGQVDLQVRDVGRGLDQRGLRLFAVAGGQLAPGVVQVAARLDEDR